MKNFIIGIAIIIIDQLSKIIVRNDLAYRSGVNVIDGLLSFVYVENYGAAFSSFSGFRYALIILPILILVACGYAYVKYRKEHDLLNFAIILVIAGGIGNLIDRVVYGFVTDMISFSFFPPVFNVADIAVTLGCFLLFVYILFIHKEGKAKKRR